MDTDIIHPIHSFYKPHYGIFHIEMGIYVFIFIPVLTGMGVSPDMTQCAYRIGDSATNAITPFMFYMPLVLTYMQQYDRQSTYGSLLKYTWRYSLVILVAWTALFVLWYVCKLR